MKNLLLSANAESFLLGLFFTIFLFFLSCAVVMAVKAFFLYIENRVRAKNFKPAPQKKENPKPKVKSIEINPEEFDKIIVKKG